MEWFFGIDTSNYTTSAALFNGEEVYQQKMLLPVKPGGLGVRQSDAVFHHNKQLPLVVEELFSDKDAIKITAMGCSSKPRNEDGSYMPCFLAGLASAKVLSSVQNVPLYEFSHQQGHIAAALFATGRLELLKREFIAFHVSGGTTEAVLVKPDSEHIISTRIIARTLDLNAGQLVDRVGVMLGYRFPCGPELEAAALRCAEKINARVTLKGTDCCLSGVQNKCEDLLRAGKSSEYIAKYCLSVIKATIEEMTAEIINIYGSLPLIYAGGVMSNSIIRESIKSRFECSFAPREFSCDNAAGTAVLAYVKHNGG